MSPRYLWARVPCRRPAGASTKDRFDTGSRQSCHAGLALKYLWVGSPCQRPARRLLRHEEMALEYLWAGSPCQRPVRRTLSHAITCIERVPLPVCAGAQASLSLPLSAAIDLHEIHLAPQSSLQVPVGHIPVPGGIKLCSPGTFLVANYLIINNDSCQVNFTKPNRAAIRNTNSQWPRRDGSEMPVGRVAVPKTGKSIGTLPFLDRSAGGSPHWDGSEVLVGKVAVPKGGKRTASPRRDASGAPVGLLSVPKTGQKPPSPREDATEVPVGKVALPKTSQKSPFATPGCLWSICGPTLRAEDRSVFVLCHAGMPLRYLWSRSPCQRLVRSPFATRGCP